jgi:hypothetical protein
MNDQSNLSNAPIARPAPRLILALLLGLLIALTPHPVLAQGPEPDSGDIPADWWSQARQQILTSEYYVTWQEQPILSGLPAAYQAPNRTHNLRAYFSPQGLTLIPRVWPDGASAPPWRYDAGLVAWGRAGALQPLPAASLHVQDNLVEYRRADLAPGATLLEAQRNSEQGLQQSITLSAPPPDSPQAAPLQLDLALGGDLVPQLDPGGLGLQFLDRDGQPVLLYGALAVSDAAGSALPVSLSLHDATLSLSIDDSTALYPLQIESTITGLPDTSSWNLTWGTANTQFAFSLATAGSVNCDPYSDLVVGAPDYDGGRTDQGAVFVYYGSPFGLAPNHMYAWSKISEQNDAHFGYAVGTAGDVNGDGCGDIIVGAPEYDHPEVNEGGAWVYHGSANGVVDDPAFFAQSNQAGAQLGKSVATAGDVNGAEPDGQRYADVIVGAWWYSRSEDAEGAAFVWHGSAGGVNGGANGIPDNADWMAESNQASGWLGISVSTAGDVNRDGFADVIIGASSYSHDQADEGAAFIWHGSASGVNGGNNGNPTNAQWMVESDQASASLGNAVSTAGDVDGDGYADVIVGAHLYNHGEVDEGAAWLYLGSATGVSADWDNMDEGNQPGAWFGFRVGTAGDVNGDGFADVIVGAPLYTNDQTEEGRAYVWHGSAGGISSIRDWWAEGNGTAAWYGSAVATAGDVNGDGYSDVVVGAPGDLSQGGTVWAYYGSSTSLESTATWVKPSNDEDAQYGFSVATAGDVNGDGYADVIVGAPFWDGQGPGPGLGDGAAWVYLGDNGGLHSGPDWYMPSPVSDARFGFSVGAAGDVDGDGFDDVIVGAPAAERNAGLVDEGAAFVYRGVNADPPVLSSPHWTKYANQANAQFGYAVGTAGDVNGDGYADVIVGAPFWNGNGGAWVYLGAGGGLHSAPHWYVPSSHSGAQFGYAVGTAGDVNGDGFSDVIVGAPLWEDDVNNEGRVWVYHGRRAGLRTTHDWYAESNSLGARMGYAAATAGDVNGDGYSDVIIGAPYYSGGGGASEGRVWVFYGTSAGLDSTGFWTRRSDQAGAYYGYSVGTAGDVNGDGYADILIGAPHMTSAVSDEGLVRLYTGSSSGVSSSYDWTAAGGQTLSWYGQSVSSAGDVNGDGYADVIIGAPQYNKNRINEGQVYLYYGNGGPGVSLLPRQRRLDDLPISRLGRSDSVDSFRLSLRAGNPFGRGDILLEAEVKLLGSRFTGTNTFVWGDYVNSNPGASKFIVPHGFLAGTPYHWRLRWHYNPATTPFMPASRWFTAPWNGWNEQDLRTGGAIIYLPLIHRNYP